MPFLTLSWLGGFSYENRLQKNDRVPTHSNLRLLEDLVDIWVWVTPKQKTRQTLWPWAFWLARCGRVAASFGHLDGVLWVRWAEAIAIWWR